MMKNQENDNMARKSMTPEEHKKVMLNILVEFSKFCDEHDLMYYLDAGTLIGAVRHKGFIPWDDDIDVNMPQKDYDQFVALTRQTQGYMTEHLQVEYPEDTIYPFLKVSDDRTVLVEFPDKNPMEVGVYIDVFPKYGIEDRKISTKILCVVCHYLDMLHWFNTYSIYAWSGREHGFVKRFIACLGRKIIKCPSRPIKLQNRIMHNYALHHPLETCKYVTTLTNGEYHKLAPKECFEGYQWLAFEGLKFKGPKDYDTYLHCLYKGDYMQMPSVNQRVHHNIEVFWK